MRAASPASPPIVPPVIAATFSFECGEVVDVAGGADWAVELGDALPITVAVLLVVVDEDFELEVEEEVEVEDDEVCVELLEVEVVLVVGADVGVKFTPV
jgi:hypothetical protein